MLAEHRDLLQTVAHGCQILAKLGLVDYRGHVTARLDEYHYVIRGRGVYLGNLRRAKPDEMIVVDLGGNVVEGTHIPPGELPLHGEVYRVRPDVRAIVHTHQPLTVAFGAVRRRILPMTAVTSPVVGADIPIFDSSRLIRNKDQGVGVAQALGRAAACHLRHHGLITVGGSVEEAVLHAIWIEEQAKMTLVASLLGTPEGIRPEEMAVQVAERDPNFAGRWAYYVGLLSEP